MRAMVYHLVIHLGKRIHVQFYHRNIQSLAKAICQIKLCIFFENQNSLYYARVQHHFSVTQYPMVSIHLSNF